MQRILPSQAESLRAGVANFFSLCRYLKEVYSVLFSVSSFERHYIVWRILSLNLHNIFLLLCGVMLLLYQTFFWYCKLRNSCTRNFVWSRTICAEWTSFSASIPTETPWICSVCDGVSSWEAAYRIELWKVFQILWAGLSSPRFFQKLSEVLFGALKKKKVLQIRNSFPQYRVAKVNPLHIICHSDVFNINDMKLNLLPSLGLDTNCPSCAHSVVSLGSGCASGVSAPSG